jgi:hypothetical protein
MLAAIARPTAVEAAIEKPDVAFNAGQRMIAATVIVSLPLGATEPIFEAPLIAIPGPGQGSDLWTVIWTLVPGPGIISATFNKEHGITFSMEEPFPPNLRIKESFQVPDHPDQWQTTFQNNVISAHSLRYFIHVELVRATDRQRLFFRHDPTIVVTQDPIG